MGGLLLKLRQVALHSKVNAGARPAEGPAGGSRAALRLARVRTDEVHSDGNSRYFQEILKPWLE